MKLPWTYVQASTARLRTLGFALRLRIAACAVALIFAGPILLPSAAAAAPSATLARAGLSVGVMTAAAPFRSDSLQGVSCPAATMCMAVGQGNSGMLAERWTGDHWSLTHPPLPAGATFGTLTAVSCTSPRACTAVGSEAGDGTGGALAERWNGRSWHVQPTPSPVHDAIPLGAVSCASATSCTAVGYYDFGVTSNAMFGMLAEHWNGRRWRIQALPRIGNPGSDLTSVSCRRSACTAAGYSIHQNDEDVIAPLALRWNGARWRVQPTPGRMGQLDGLQGLSCASTRQCIAVGASAERGSLALRWNGTSWHQQRNPQPGLAAVSCPSTTACIAVGYGPVGSAAAQRWNGATWTVQRVPTIEGARDFPFTAVSCSSASHCTAVGSANIGRSTLAFADRWNGRRWVLQAPLNPPPP
jgi:hypothetical protein